MAGYLNVFWRKTLDTVRNPKISTAVSIRQQERASTCLAGSVRPAKRRIHGGARPTWATDTRSRSSRRCVSREERNMILGGTAAKLLKI
jgi:hypothetical protein